MIPRSELQTRKILILVEREKGKPLVSAVEPNTVEKVVVDLCVGNKYWRPEGATPLAAGERLRIKPGECICVQTRESLTLPNNAFGLLCSRGSMSRKGIFVANTKIDPKFSGSLKIPVLNSSKREIELDFGESFCSIAFVALESAVDGDTRSPPEDEGEQPKPSFWIKTGMFLKTNLSTIISVIAAAAAVGSCWAARYAPQQVSVQQSSPQLPPGSQRENPPALSRE